MVNRRFSSLTRAILALSGLAAAALSSSSCSSKDIKGEPCASGASCGEVCCSSDRECVQDTCLPLCATQLRCGAANELCCAADEECQTGGCVKKCTPDCQKPDGSGPKKCGDDGCGHACPPGCGDGEQCNARFDCEQAPAVGNDSCAAPGHLQFTAGVAREHGTTTGARNDSMLPCASQLYGLDVVYSFALAKAQKVTVSVEPDEGSALRPVVALRSDCASVTNLRCAAPPAAGGATTLEVGKLPAGEYFVWVAADVASLEGTGPFALTVTLADADAPPANDTCATATLIDLTANGHAVVRGDLTSANDDTTARTPNTTCQSLQATPGPDVVYKFEVPVTLGFSASVAFDSPASQAVAGLYLRKSCDADGQEVGCPKDIERLSALQVAALPRGTYYLFVDTGSLAGEPFTLSVDVGAAPANDSCATGAQPIVLDAAGNATINGDTALANNDSSGEGLCSAQANDVVYKLHLDHDQSVTFTVTPTGPTFAPVVYVRSACAGADSLACGSSRTAQPVTLPLRRLTAGDWFVWVGGYSAPVRGSFTLSVSTADVTVPANDVCADAIPLTLDAGTTVHVDGFTTGGWNDYQGTCGAAGPALDGPDVVYKVTLTEAGPLSVTVTRDETTTNTLWPAVYVRTNNCASTAAADEKACARAILATPGTVTALVPSAEATTYYIIVDGMSGTAGPFTLHVTAHGALTNDTCSSPKDIPLDATTGIGSVRGDTTPAHSDACGTCQDAMTPSPDLVYRFTLAQDRAVTVDLTPEGAAAATYKPVLFVRQICDERASESLQGCAAMTTAGATAHLSFNVLAQGTYFVWVAGNETVGLPTSGAFTLTVTTAAPPAAAPAGDTCATAIPLTLTATAADPAVAQATATGDTTNARDNALGLGLCEASAAGDLVYRVTLAQAQKLKAVVTPDAASGTFRPAVYIRGGACASSADADQLAGGVATAAGGTAIAAANSLAQGTYWIWVDSLANAGGFTLEVTASPPAAGPANDTCAAPQALTLTGTTATVTGTTVGAQNDSASAPYGALGGDVVYSITTTNTDPRTLKASVVGATGAPASFLPVVSVRKRCAGLADVLSTAQATSSTEPATTPPIPTGAAGSTYFIWVDTGNQGLTGPTPDPFTLTVTVEVANDQCGWPIDLTGGTLETGDTTHAVDQYGTTGGFSAVCAAALGGTTRTPGPEVVYAFDDFWQMPSFTVTVTPDAGFDAVVWVTHAPGGAAGCGVAANCVAAANAAGPGGVESITVTPDGGRYYILVDSAQASEVGGFTIQVQ